MTTLAFGARLTPEERVRVLRIAARLGCDPSHLMACMHFESKLDPAAVNPTSGASGLIQFMPGEGRSADALGTTTEALRAMTRIEQLDFVDRYFDLPWVRGAGRMPTLADVYMAIFAPAHIGKADDFVLYEAPSQAYAQNRALDLNNDGKITKAEAASFPARALAEGLKPGNATEERDLRPGVPEPSKEKRMGAIAGPLLASLIPQVLGLFTARAQATIAEKTNADPQLLQQFMQGLIQKVGESVGVPVADDKTAIAAVGKLVTDVQPGTPEAKALEDHSLDYLHKLSEAAQSMVDVRKAEVAIEVDSANAAAARTDASDVRMRIDRKVWWAYGIAGAILAVIAIVELVITKLIDGQIIGALILAFGALGGAIITMVNYGYGSSGSSGAKDVLIGEMARRQSKEAP